MAPKTIRKKSSLKRKTLRSPRSARTTRKQAEEMVQSSDDFLRRVIDVDPHFIFAKDRDGRFTLANQAVADAYGTTIEDLIGKTDADFNPNRTEVELFLKMDREVMDVKRERFIPEEVITDAAGKKRWLQTIKRPIIGKDGRANQVLGVSTDITERKKAEEALRQLNETLEQRVAERTAALYESNTRLQGMLDYSPSPILMKDLQGHYVDVNKQFEETFHLTHQDIIGKTDADIFPPEYAAAYRANDLEVLKAGRSLQFEEVALHDDGLHTNIVWKFPLRRLDGTPYAICGIVTDITERKRAEAALRESEKRFRAFTSATNDVVYCMSPDWTEMRHLQGREFISDTLEPSRIWLDKYIHVDDQQHVMETIQRAIQSKSVFELEHRVIRTDDSLGWTHSRAIPILDERGEIVEWFGAAGDVTQRKKAEEALHQKQRELQSSQAQLQDLTAKLLTAQDSERQRIARDLHDDFGQRLTALVLDVASLTKHPPRLPELIGKALEPVCKELEQLTSDLHDLAYRLHPPLLRHAGLQAAIEDHIHKAIERTGLHIALKAKDLPDSVPLDWSICLFRVFQESLQNVVKHARATEVMVKLSGSSKGIGLSVVDNGKGFDVSDKIGHPKGMGLISMQERLRLLNGFLNIHSRPADGTKVCAWIPLQGKKL